MVESANVIYISYDGITDPLGQSQIIPYLEGLSKYGYQIHILSCEKKSRFNEQQHLIYELFSQSNIIWHPIPYTSKPPVISTLYDIWKLKSNARKLNKVHNFAIVHCRSYIAAFVGLYLKKNNNIKFIFDMRGFWVDERVEGGIWNIKNPIYFSIFKYFKRKEQDFLLNSDYVISLTEKAKTVLIQRFLKKNKVPKIEVIPCCADTDFFSQKNIYEPEEKIISEQLNINSEDFIVSYSGSVGTWYMLDEMLDFFYHLCKAFVHAKFLFITHDNPEKIIDTARKKEIDTKRIIIIKANRKQMPVLLSLSDVAMFFIKPVYSKMASSPTKMGEIMSMGIPFITNTGIGDIDTFIQKNKVGLLVEEFTTSSYNEVIKKIPQLLKLNHESIRDFAKKEYSLNHGVNKYHSIYDQLINNE